MKFKGFTLKLLMAAIVLIIVLGLTVVYFSNIVGFISILVGLFAPFIIAFILSLILNPIANKLSKKLKLPRTVISIILIVIVIGILGGVVGGIVYKIVQELKSLYQDFPQYSQKIIEWVMSVRSSIESMYSSMPDYVQKLLDSLVENMQSSMAGFIDKNYQPVVDGAGNIAKKVPGIFIGLIVFLLSLFFMISNEDNLKGLIKKIFPMRFINKVKSVSSEMKKTLGGYIKAQVIIMSVVFVIVMIGLSVLRVEYALLIAIAIALFDALPFFGSGAVLIPWSIISFINSNFRFGVGLLIIYLSVLLTRQMIEPKIVSSKIGINPLVTLASMYVGYRVFSLGGMILGPILMVIIISLKKAGIFDPIIRFGRFILRYIKNEITEIGNYIDKK